MAADSTLGWRPIWVWTADLFDVLHLTLHDWLVAVVINANLSIREYGVSSITVAELFYGVKKSQHRQQNQAALMQFMSPLEIAGFDTDAAFSYGQIRAALDNRGTPIGSMDTLIARHAASTDATLVTNDELEFSRVPGLFVENWVVE